jgi:hypothetical protein
MKTVNLKLAKALKEAGYPQDAYLSYYYNAGKPTGSLVQTLFYDDASKAFKASKLSSAPTADEILEKLPETIGKLSKPNFGGLTISKYKEAYSPWYCSAQDRSSLLGPTLMFMDENLADALANLYLYLKKKGLI